ncbi:hypothetical protein TWF730_011079 [Orbilia blumenaviensis]|uniref:Nucleoside phosphorylase domain-containing protein n=1 Tax=Orbilia blumenaviensis TaxID=1796055 RepID=A0AAV9UK48_9PEZI
MADSPAQGETKVTAGRPHSAAATQTPAAQQKDPRSPTLKSKYKQPTGSRTSNPHTQGSSPAKGNEDSGYYDEVNSFATRSSFETQGQKVPLRRPIFAPRKASEGHKSQIRNEIPRRASGKSGTNIQYSARCLYPDCTAVRNGESYTRVESKISIHLMSRHPYFWRRNNPQGHFAITGPEPEREETIYPVQAPVSVSPPPTSRLLAALLASNKHLPSTDKASYGYALRSSGRAFIGKCDNPTPETDTTHVEGLEFETLQFRTTAAKVKDTKAVSDSSSIMTATKEHYISELADTLFQGIHANRFNHQTLNNISESLPELLKAFAVRIGYKAPSQIHRDVMFFIHKNRRDIASLFRKKHARKYEELLDAGLKTGGSMSRRERKDLQRARTEFLPAARKRFCRDENKIPEIYVPEEARFEDGYANINEALQAYRDCISNDLAYEWLTQTLQSQAHLISGGHTCMDDIKKKIIAFLPSTRTISKTESSEAFNVCFMTGFKPFDFIKEQEYTGDLEPGDAIMKSITLTGSLDDAQALPCAQYLIQTWPLTGRDIVELIKKVLRGSAVTSHKCTLWDKTELTISIRGSELIAEALGPSPSIIEIGQQMAWLSAAFRASSRETAISICVPSIQYIVTRNDLDPDPQISSPPLILCKFDFLSQQHSKAIATSRGQCWHGLFRNPVVVVGYPISRRPSAGTGRGLEIPLNIMAALVGTNHVQLFNRRLYIKRFSAMLIPTKREDDILVWHLLYKPDGGHISYLDSADAGHLGSLDISKIETLRHILGWCSDVRYYAGASDANYKDIRESGLPIPDGDNYVLGKVHIQGGRIIKGGFPVILGKRDIPPHIPREDFGGRLQWIDEKPFVLWDEQDKRGWLVNGSSILLHLLRKSLDSKGASTNKFSFNFRFKKEFMQEAPITHTPASAVRVLWNETNLKLELYRKSEGNFCVQDRVDELLNVLEQIVEHQIGIGKRELGNENNISKEHLEGWDFNDLATSEDPYYPRFATFAKPSGGWIKFSRVINAAILFGRKFGEIIRAENIACSRWATVPTGKYYLAAAIDDLREIMKKNAGDQYSSPMRLTSDIIWHTPNMMFGKCKCGRNKREGKHSNFIQVALPTQQYNQAKKEKAFHLGNGGAVIFGRNHRTQRLLYERESLLGDEVPSAYSKHDTSFNGTRSDDSGVGLSQTPSLLPNFNCSEYRVGIICALPKEFFAVRALFDNEHGDECLKSLCTAGDAYVNNYALGCFFEHKVVAVCLSSGGYGLSAASTVYTNLSRSFRELKLCLLVGIGGGVPSKNIRLGDVVVSHPTGNYPGVIQYDFGQEFGTEFKIKGTLERPPDFILGAISKLKSNPNKSPQPLQAYLKAIEEKDQEYGHPGREKDHLFIRNHSSRGNSSIPRYHQYRTTQNFPHIEDDPRIHYGLIGSANRVMKDAKIRDQLSEKYNFLCFEMEAAAIMDGRNCKGLVIRGISDYSDSTKDDVWQNYAAATAAAYAKFLLSTTMIPGGMESLQMGSVETQPMKRILTPEYLPARPDPTRKRRRKEYTLQS